MFDRTMIATLMILAATTALPTLAAGPRGATNTRPANPGAPTNRPGGPVAPHGRGLLVQLVFPCEAACTDAAKSCTEAANTAALDCTSAACPTEITAAQTACQADRMSADCMDAFDALAECAATCLATNQDAITACRSTLTSCRAACTD